MNHCRADVRSVFAAAHPLIAGDQVMEAVKILEKPEHITWDYDEEAGVLYLSVGEPVSALDVDIGQGVVLRYDEPRKEVVGLTITGIRARLLQGLRVNAEEAS